jgi:hypothetical protein
MNMLGNSKKCKISKVKWLSFRSGLKPNFQKLLSYLRNHLIHMDLVGNWPSAAQLAGDIHSIGGYRMHSQQKFVAYSVIYDTFTSRYKLGVGSVEQTGRKPASLRRGGAIGSCCIRLARQGCDLKWEPKNSE